MHYYSFNIGDYRKDTSHLKPIEHYIYRTLIDMYYLDEKPITKETQWVMRRLGLETQSEEMALKMVLLDFFVDTDDGFTHERIEEEIKAYQANTEKNRKNGKKGGRPPKNKSKETQSVIDGLPVESQINPNQEPLTNNQEPLTNKQIKENERKELVSSLFEKWKVLSGKKDKSSQARLSHINARLDDGFTADEITQAMNFVATDSEHLEKGWNTIELAIRSVEQIEKKLLASQVKQNNTQNTGFQNANTQQSNSKPSTTKHFDDLRAQLAESEGQRRDTECRTVSQ